jgi:hypothetical protein
MCKAGYLGGLQPVLWCARSSGFPFVRFVRTYSQIVQFDWLRFDLNFAFSVAGATGDPTLIAVVKVAAIPTTAGAGDDPELWFGQKCVYSFRTHLGSPLQNDCGPQADEADDHADSEGS